MQKNPTSVWVDKDTHRRILKSAVHWFRLAHGIEEPWEGIGQSSCALCQRFFRTIPTDTAPTCEGCPIAEVSGQTHCDGTPYEDAAHEYLSNHDASVVKPRHRHAKRQLRFLLNLAEKVTVRE